MINTVRPWLITLLKLAIAVALVLFLLRQGTLDFSLILNGALSIPATLIGVGLFLVTYFLSTIRWQLLLKTQGGTFPFPWVMKVTFIGIFFNYFLPGGVGGDAVRMTYTHRATKKNQGALTISVALDKIFGLYSLLLICLAATLANLEWMLTSEPVQLLFFVSLLLVASVPITLGFLWLTTRPGSRFRGWLKKSPQKNWDRLIHLMVTTLRNHAWDLKRTALALLTSVLSQSTAILSVVWIAHATQIGDLPPLHYAMACAWAWPICTGYRRPNGDC